MKSYVSYKTILEKIGSSTSTSRNIIEIVDNNGNPYRSIVIDLLKMNGDYLDEGLHNIIILDEEPNIDVIRFFKLLCFFFDH